jgi:16S rRNA (adenine1518-N6/adenine1519-N6)-dimethyltransferase
MKPTELKKSLGQHFLHDPHMQQKIADATGNVHHYATLIEVGPGKGALSFKMLAKKHPNYWLVEIDPRWVGWLKTQVGSYFDSGKKILHEDFLQLSLDRFQAPVYVIGNFPYNISSQIVFKVIAEREKITSLTGMFQKEVARRIAAVSGSKEYGIISVLAQAYFECSYLFDVPPECFTPPPKVMSGVICMKRHYRSLNCDETNFIRLVKQAFSQRRKTLRNSLRAFIPENSGRIPYLDKRPEQLSVEEFCELTNYCVFKYPYS